MAAAPRVLRSAACRPVTITRDLLFEGGGLQVVDRARGGVGGGWTMAKAVDHGEQTAVPRHAGDDRIPVFRLSHFGTCGMADHQSHR